MKKLSKNCVEFLYLLLVFGFLISQATNQITDVKEALREISDNLDDKKWLSILLKDYVESSKSRSIQRLLDKKDFQIETTQKIKKNSKRNRNIIRAILLFG